MGGQGSGSRHWTPEQREQANAKMRAAWTPERREAQRRRLLKVEPYKSPRAPLAAEAVSRARVIALAYWTPERRAAARAAWTPERRAAQAARTRASMTEERRREIGFQTFRRGVYAQVQANREAVEA